MSQTEALLEQEAENASQVSPPSPYTGSVQNEQHLETLAETTDAVVFFVDHNGKRFIFPWVESKTWQGMKNLIERAYSRGDNSALLPEVAEEKFDLLLFNGDVALPEVWGAVIRPMETVRLSLWSLPYVTSPQPPPEPPAVAGAEAPGTGTSFPPDQELDDVVIIQERGQSHRHKGATRIPKRFAREQDDFLVIRRALKKSQIDEIIKMSESWREPIEEQVRALEEERRVLEEERRNSPRSGSRFRPRSGSNSRSKSRSHDSRSRARSRSPARSVSGSRSRSRSRSQSRDSVISFPSSEESSLESVSDASSSGSVSTDFESPRPWEPPRDRDGNHLSFLAKHSEVSDQVQSEETSRKPPAPRPMIKEPVDILEAHMARMSSNETKTYVFIRQVNSPQKPGSKDIASIRWHHLHAFDELDFYAFKDACTSVPKVSTQACHAVSTLLARVETENIKTALDGMFIEQGTVLRCDFKDGQGKEHAVIFSCVPYFDLQAPMKPRLSRGQRLHPVRTLMSTLYPYEDVVERDREQAFRKHGNNSSESIIHVPVFWMLCIGSEAIVTCGYKTLSATLGPSILMERDIQKLGRLETAVDIRFTDWEGRVFLFPRERCNTFFEFEQKVREIRSASARQAPIKGTLKFVLVQEKGKTLLRPGNWVEEVHSLKTTFVDILILNEPGHMSDGTEALEEWDSKEEISQNGATPENDSSQKDAAALDTTIRRRPFLAWKSSTMLQNEIEGLRERDAPVEDQNTAERTGMIKKLALVERNLLFDTLENDVVDHDVDKGFASTDYYKGLSERKFETAIDAVGRLKAGAPLEPPLLLKTDFRPGEYQGPGLTDEIHSRIIDFQRYNIARLANKLLREISETFSLYVSDPDMSPTLGKVWSALSMIAAVLQKAVDTDAQVTGKSKAKLWTLRKRSDFIDRSLAPELGSWLPQHIKRCKTCRKAEFATEDQAIKHLQKQCVRDNMWKPMEGDEHDPNPEFRPSLRSDSQMRFEERNSAIISILSKSIKGISKLRLQAMELAEGVTFDKETVADPYALPLSLVESLRRFVVLFLGVERAIFFVDNRFKDWKLEHRKEIMEYFTDGMTALQRFESSVHISLAEARKDLCFMVRSPPSESNFLLKLSVGPEFILAWLIRRLLVKPIDHNVGTPELYREYLSALAFQVNHHPRKRLLRDINLLQEELHALDQVNRWQVKLVENYIAVLDDNSFATEIAGRRALFEHEENLLSGFMPDLLDDHEDYVELLGRCQPLIETTKQSTEINEEDHGKAILVFTLVTIIFLPLSFVTSYLGMNTIDIRNMENKQSLFWEIALPLTAVTVGSILLVAYNGDQVHDFVSSVSHTLTGKKSKKSRHTLSVAQRKRFTAGVGSSSDLDYRSTADSAEYALPVTNPLAGVISRLPPRVAPGRTNTKVHYEDDYYGESISAIRKDSRSRTYTTQRNEMAMPAPMRSPAVMPLERGRPTYARVHRKYVTSDSLAHFGLPWEYDAQDPYYVIITKDMSTYDLDELFEHSRRAINPQTRTKTRRRIPKIYVDDKKAEYTWVRKKANRGTHHGETSGRSQRKAVYVD
ncbi:uncharacterized protein BDZ99DRAFT_533424 [Mytilinidion resinicola]|uniref:Ubiquitin-like domain-containing protein n=1 Tax=Mytilinidion resinicola TaxID=574789 RepID=A0A6A6YJS4_9PEZI|nr:uncharacterized protein BDZ99DRAFT_533424 [Mytilinidion resinicola]KAF2809040.1 hypothetical protein BDZ99DRAFT_533424 [Mytilinidion resinicola]